MKHFFRTLKEELHLTLQTAWRSGVGKNAASLYLIQFANYILPLIVVPYLVRVLGPEHFGLVAFGQGLIAYFNIFVGYGFALSATRRISVERDDLLAVSRTASSVWVAKGLFCVLALAILLLVITVVPKLQEVSILFLILYGVVVGNALFPVWLFQGMEKMFFISAINLAMRFLVVAGVFTLIRRPEDYLLYAGLTSLGALGAGVAGVVIAFYRFKLCPFFPSLTDILETLKEGWLLFLSTASVSLYTAGNAFILGMLTNPTVVGYYSAAEKVVRAVQMLLGPVSQSAYPRFVKKAAIESKDSVLYWARRGLIIQATLGFTLSSLIFVGAPLIVHILFGLKYTASILVMRILAPLPLLVGIGSSLGQFVMLPFGMDAARLTILTIAGIMNVLLGIFLSKLWLANGMALAVVISEMVVSCSFWLYLKTRNLSPV